MNIRPLLATTAALAFVFLASVTDSVAESKKATYQKELFEIADGNGDGKVTEKEFVILMMYEIYVHYDANKDAKLTEEEFMKAISGPEAKNASKEWALMDPDGSGEITFRDALKNKPAVDEFVAEFKRLDKKGKGHITMDDLPKVD